MNKKPRQTEPIVAANAIRSADRSILSLLTVAAFVCGWMCYKGGLQIFSGHTVTAAAFAVVVQGTIVLVLWYVAYVPLRQRMILFAVWAVAAAFSTGAAFFYADQDNWEGVVSDAKIAAATYISDVQAKINTLTQTANELHEKARVEAARGGCGPKCRALQDQAASAVAAVKTAEPAAGAIAAARDRLNSLDPKSASLEDVRNVVTSVQSAAGDVATGIPLPEGEKTLNFFDRVSYVYSVIFGIQSGKSGERFKFALTLGLASLIEILGLMLSIVHMMMHLKPDSRPFAKRLADSLGWLIILKNLPANARKSADQLQFTVFNGRVPSTEAAEQTKKTSQASATARWAVAPEWGKYFKNLANATNTSESELMRKLIVVPVGSKKKDRDLVFDAMPFANDASLASVAAATKVAAFENNEWTRGDNWVAWQRYMLRELADFEPKSSPRGVITRRAA